uniref:Crinkling and necrosis inducing protein 6 n=1 Tax=Phytophthora capsici TaxID=4784 RepID=A0A1L1URS8_PHYCP|nr:crinkling and necrosis inducing protein 6 [Phytophthora capsici]
MMKLFCAIVGAQGTAFSVDIDVSQSVGDLKKAIKHKNEDIKCPHRDLQLFLAKNEKDEWLSSKDPDGIFMRNGGIPEQVKNLMNVEVDPADEISNVFKNAPTTETVHVLVKPYRTAPNVELMSFTSTCWLVTGLAENALDTRGVRSQLYRLADTELGYYDPANVHPDTGSTPRAFWHENNSIQIHVLFKKGAFTTCFYCCCDTTDGDLYRRARLVLPESFGW